ncbi:Mpo1 family 2-hydroxy fatty acid dioxygenase [Marinomonas polaris]|uniref:Mpo1 family 2-hydroxy fatty acid dioxygenase n=1 Tax=Marinomonas polaris TaxID=293552 RepID=UPI003F98B88F
MKTMLEHLSQYAFYHQDRRNVATHFVGIPMIVVGIAVLLSRPHFTLLDIVFTPALIIALASSVFYVRLNKMIGIVMTILLALIIGFAEFVAVQSTFVWLITGISLFVVGWIFQFVGHYFEGKKPAFLDDITGLIIGPLFVFVELLFLLGLKRDWQQTIERSCEKQNKAVNKK